MNGWRLLNIMSLVSTKKNKLKPARPARPVRSHIAAGNLQKPVPYSWQPKTACPCGGGCLRCAPAHMISRQAEDEDEALQAKSAGSKDRHTAADLDDRIQALQGRGRTLPQPTRSFFESRFGQDFRQVRVHTDNPSADMARGMNARAFTRQKDIVFAPGQYAPDAHEGRHLLAHELTHVVQQAGGEVISRTPGAPVISTRERHQLLGAIRTKIAQINGALTNGYAWAVETYLNGIIEIGVYGMRFPVAHRHLYLLRLRRFLTDLRSRVLGNNVPDPATHPTGAHHYVTVPFELQWLVSHYLEEQGITDPAFDMFIHYTEFNPVTTSVMPRVSGVARPQNLGRYLVVADPVRRPTDVELLDPFRRQSGVILDLWQEAGVYFYYFRGRKHYLPDFRLH